MLRAFRNFIATVLAALCLSGLSARSDDIPTLDVNPVCRGIAMQGELEVGLQQTSFQQCVQSEQAVRADVKKEWSTFSTADKTHCVALAKTGGEVSIYVRIGFGPAIGACSVGQPNCGAKSCGSPAAMHCAVGTTPASSTVTTLSVRSAPTAAASLRYRSNGRGIVGNGGALARTF